MTETSTELQPAPQADVALLSVIAAAARDPKVDVEKMEQLLAMHERISARQAENAFTEAMNHVQALVPRMVKDRSIIVKGQLRSKYAALENIDREVRPLIIADGFSLTYSTEDVPPKATRLILTVKHRMGHKESFSIVLPIDNNEYRSASQNAASTISFGRRILLCMAFNIITVDEDKDGNPNEDYITEADVLDIVDLLQQCGLPENQPKFLAWAGVDRIEHIKKSGLTRVKAKLTEMARAR